VAAGTRSALLLVLLAAFVAVPSAAAKGPFQVCGATGCTELGPETAPPVRLGADAATAAVGPVAPASYFVVRFAEFGSALAYWIPSAGLLRLSQSQGGALRNVWVATLPAEDALLRDKAAGLTPFAAPAHLAVTVNSTAVKRKDADSYFRLFTIGTPIASEPAGVAWQPIWVHGGASPWNDGLSSFAVSRKGSLLKRDGQVVRISSALAKRIRAARALAG
jgi:hypothetical protein